MNVGIIGAGNIGGIPAGLLINAGDAVLLAESRGKESLASSVAALGNRAVPGSVREVAAAGDVIIEAIPFGKVHHLPRPELDKKVLITAADYYPGRDSAMDPFQ